MKRTRIALIIDILLLPVLIPCAILWEGLPSVWHDLKELPKVIGDEWRRYDWWREK